MGALQIYKAPAVSVLSPFVKVLHMTEPQTACHLLLSVSELLWSCAFTKSIISWNCICRIVFLISTSEAMHHLCFFFSENPFNVMILYWSDIS